MKKPLSLKNLLWTNLTIKLCSLIFGLGLWATLNQSTLHDKSFHAQLYYFGSSLKKIEGPESINVTLRGTRSGFSKLGSSPTIYINTQSLRDGKNTMIITQDHLFLPQDINMVHCNPRLAEIIVSDAQEL